MTLHVANDADSQPIRVLALDGGGVRGLSSLLVLRELMERIGVQRGTPVRPSECFDLIVGTGTGGISAIFLGRMHMTVEESIKEYIRMADMAFTPSTVESSQRWLSWSSKTLLDGSALERSIRDVSRRFLADCDAPFADPIYDHTGTSCRTAVLACTTAQVNAPPYVFRSYTINNPASTFTIGQVARAAVATAGVFTHVALGTPPVMFVDASLAGYNNPSEVGLAEAATIWPGRPIDCLVSLGTGLQKIISVDEGLAKVAQACADIVHSCEQVHNRVFSTRQREGMSYFRFNVNRGLDTVDVTEWNEAGSLGNLGGITDAYIRWAEVGDRLDACVRSLNKEKMDHSNSMIIDDAEGINWSPEQELGVVLKREDVVAFEELYIGSDYRLHLANHGSKVVVMKVFEGTRAKHAWQANVTAHRRLLHPNLLHMIGASVLGSHPPFIVFDGACQNGGELLLANALRTDLTLSVKLAFQLFHDLSSSLDYIRTQGVYLGSIGLESFDIILGNDNNFRIGFSPGCFDNNDQESGQSDIINSADMGGHQIYNGLCRKEYQKTLLAANQILYQEPLNRETLPLSASTSIETDSSDGLRERPAASPAMMHPTESSSVLPRREFIWRDLVRGSMSLKSVSLQFKMLLKTSFSPSSLLPIPRLRSHRPARTFHRCKGYIREEITLTSIILDSAVVSHTTPTPQEICIVCHATVQEEGIFNCICEGHDDGNKTTVKCTRCSKWQHSDCVLPSNPVDYVCDRCAQGNVSLLRDTSSDVGFWEVISVKYPTRYCAFVHQKNQNPSMDPGMMNNGEVNTIAEAFNQVITGVTGTETFEAEDVHAYTNIFPSTSTKTLDIYIREVDRNDSNPKCFFCKYKGCTHPLGFFKKKEIIKHIRTEHLREKPFICTRCNTSFAYEREARRHVATMNGNKCSACQSVFVRKDYRDLHEKRCFKLEEPVLAEHS